MNDHRDDGRSRDQSDLSHTEQNRNEQQQISHQEPELLEGLERSGKRDGCRYGI